MKTLNARDRNRIIMALVLACFLICGRSCSALAENVSVMLPGQEQAAEVISLESEFVNSSHVDKCGKCYIADRRNENNTDGQSNSIVYIS